MRGLIASIAFGLSDLIHTNLDPYSDFTRPFLPPANNVALSDKAKYFISILYSDFYLESGLYLYNLAFEGEEPDFGDQAVHQGLAVSALAFLNKLGELDPVTLLHAMRGQSRLYENEKLIRGRDPRDSSKFADNASNDSACGQLAGIYFSRRYYSGQGAGTENIKLLANELIQGGYALLRQDGTPTTYGRLINGLLTDPERSALAMAIFRTAYYMTHDTVYNDHFNRLYKSYGSLLPFAEFKFLDFTHSHESHRCALALHILGELALGDREITDRCSRGLARIWSLHYKTRDPWIAALVNPFVQVPSDQMADVVNRLREYPPSGKPPCSETINSSKSDYWAKQGVKFIEVRKHVRASQPLPYHVLPSQDFWPQRHPYMCDGWEGSKDTRVRHNPVDFLAPYGLLKLQGEIKQND